MFWLIDESKFKSLLRTDLQTNLQCVLAWLLQQQSLLLYIAPSQSSTGYLFSEDFLSTFSNKSGSSNSQNFAAKVIIITVNMMFSEKKQPVLKARTIRKGPRTYYYCTIARFYITIIEQKELTFLCTLHTFTTTRSLIWNRRIFHEVI